MVAAAVLNAKTLAEIGADMTNTPDIWTDEYMAKAEALGEVVRRSRHSNYEAEYRSQLLLADALLESRKEVSALRKALESMASACEVKASLYEKSEDKTVAASFNYIAVELRAALAPASGGENDEPVPGGNE